MRSQLQVLSRDSRDTQKGGSDFRGWCRHVIARSKCPFVPTHVIRFSHSGGLHISTFRGVGTPGQQARHKRNMRDPNNSAVIDRPYVPTNSWALSFVLQLPFSFPRRTRGITASTINKRETKNQEIVRCVMKRNRRTHKNALMRV